MVEHLLGVAVIGGLFKCRIWSVTVMSFLFVSTAEAIGPEAFLCLAQQVGAVDLILGSNIGHNGLEGENHYMVYACVK